MPGTQRSNTNRSSLADRVKENEAKKDDSSSSVAHSDEAKSEKSDSVIAAVAEVLPDVETNPTVVTESGKSAVPLSPPETIVKVDPTTVDLEDAEKPKKATSAAAQARADKLSPTGPGQNMYSGGTGHNVEAPKGATLLNTPSEIALANKVTPMQFVYAEPLYVAEENKDDE